ncbi:hypothetical protein DV532_27610 (plasmid) [Pseudomonas sp. Leaf58]|uniref:type I-F CRISPR-associated protein Csy2 n=1 Tax=Pseudomonas sp. Leaf58 TaxID=1736226 RepID=UPI0006F271A7|nr:type I-F CRISPR-associated protein Csy2 [Pseudomonas sp. Leaf58]AYG48050.1 hypothetical protein DV532_27610 [Pseudomonas sp. Leaf58]KQN62396.1 hypothetical protein ASF02_09610 [Pseudomonas sp. Leaf58]
MNTLLIPFMANNVNMSPSVHVFGTLSMTGLAGFGHAVVRMISSVIGLPLADHGVALALTEHHYFPHYQRPSWTKRPLYAKAVGGAPVQEFRIGSLAGFAIVRFEAKDEAFIAVRQQLSLISHNLGKLRLAGGQFFPDPRGVKLFENDSDGALALAKVPYDARVYVDHTHLIQRYALHHGVDDLEALLALVTQPNTPDTPRIAEAPDGQSVLVAECGEQVPEQALEMLSDDLEFDFSIFDSEDEWGDVDAQVLLDQEGWLEEYFGRLIPVDIGYRLLEEPVQRRHRYTDEHPYPHAYAEPVTGLARLQIVASCRKQAAPIFWTRQSSFPYLTVTGRNS